MDQSDYLGCVKSGWILDQFFEKVLPKSQVLVPHTEIQPVHSEGDQPWDFFRRNDAKAEAPVLWPPHVKSWLIGKDWCSEGLGAGGEGDDRGWDGGRVSLTRWTWVWVNSGRWWWTGRPGVLRFMGSQRVGHNWVMDLNCVVLFQNFLPCSIDIYILFLFLLPHRFDYCSFVISSEVREPDSSNSVFLS